MFILRNCLAALLGVMLGANVLAQNGGSTTMLDTLFAKLQAATDPMAIQSLESAIWEQWIMVPDGQPRELMLRQTTALRDARPRHLQPAHAPGEAQLRRERTRMRFRRLGGREQRRRIYVRTG